MRYHPAMHSCRWLLLAWVGVVAAALPRTGWAAEVGDLREQIQVELEPRTPQEYAFLDRVILLVEQDQVPLALVQQMFQWARGKRPYPFTYFQRGLIERAAREGISLEKKPAEPGFFAGLFELLPTVRARLKQTAR